MFVVYGLYENDNLFYIGKTTEARLQKRLNEHRSSANKKDQQKNNIKIYNKLRKILKDGGDFSIKSSFSCGTEEEVNAKEIELISLYGIKTRNGTGILYNSTKGGEGTVGVVYSKETRAKMSKAKMGNKINLGRKRPDMRERFNKPVYVYDVKGAFIIGFTSQMEAAAHMGITNKCISKNIRGNSNSIFWENANINVMFKYDYMGECIQPYLGKISRKNIKIDQFTKDGDLVNSFNSIQEAHLTTGIDSVTIGNCVRRKQKTSGGYCWKERLTEFAEERINRVTVT